MAEKSGRSLKFKSEKEFVEYLLLNINEVVKDFFNEEVSSIEVDKPLHFRKFGPNLPRIDLIVTTKSNKRIGIECKNPKQSFHETSRAISQLLAYGVLADEVNDPFDTLALITSDRHNIGCKIITKYNLPIKIFYVDREKHGELR